MKYFKEVKPVLIERLHRYVFDCVYIQNYQPNITGWFALWLYNFLVNKNHNWRFDLYKYGRTFVRYSDYDRNN